MRDPTDYEWRGRYAHAYWTDLKAPATAINPPGAASDPDVEATTGLLLFDSGGTELIYTALQMPHEWVEGSFIVPHVHWTKTSSAAGNVVWQLRYRYANAGEVFTGWSAALQQSSVVAGTPDNNTDWEHLISSFGSVEIPTGLISMMLIVEIARIGGDAADTYAADARLLEFDIHYQLNAPGSVEQFEKYSEQSSV